MKGFALLALALALQSAFFFSVMMTPTASEAAAHLADAVHGDGREREIGRAHV